jgi:hypothetical protein
MTPEYTHTIAPFSKPIGYWVMYPQATPYITFSVYYKPTEEQIKNTEELLGWKWKDSV